MATLADIQNRKVTLKGNKRTQTVRVKFRTNGAVGIINLKHFDSYLHEQLSPEEQSTARVEEQTTRTLEEQAALDREAEVAAAQRVTPFTIKEMGEMSLDALKMLPEWERIPAAKRAKLKDKDDIVAELVRYRS